MPSIDLFKMVNHGALMAIGWKDLPGQWTKMWYQTTRGSDQGIKTMGQKHWHERAIDKKQKWQGKKKYSMQWGNHLHGNLQGPNLH